MYDFFIKRHYETGKELWEALSPTKELKDGPNNFVFRGQWDSDLNLIPSILRHPLEEHLNLSGSSPKTYDEQVHLEFTLLIIFYEFCNNNGIQIPQNSIDFKKENLDFNYMDKYFKTPSLWPNPKLLEFMALAQHYGIPTRLLDWTSLPYIAIFFAATSAICNFKKWEKGKNLALWCLDLEKINLYKGINYFRVPNAISANMTAQKGAFIYYSLEGNRGEKIKIKSLDEKFSILPDTPLIKLTTPINQATILYQMCLKIGINAGNIYPGIYGAAKAVTDNLNWWAVDRKLRNDSQ